MFDRSITKQCLIAQINNNNVMQVFILDSFATDADCIQFHIGFASFPKQL